MASGWQRAVPFGGEDADAAGGLVVDAPAEETPGARRRPEDAALLAVERGGFAVRQQNMDRQAAGRLRIPQPLL